MTEPKKYIFEKLTPVTDGDISVYESAIDFVFKHNDVKNVAISGAYGAGKSSVLASYKAKHSDIKFLHISLAHFQSGQESDDSDVHIKNSILEGKILNQLIHQMPAENIPQTNFRVKKSTGNGVAFCYTAATAIFLLSLLHVVFFNAWSKFVTYIPNGINRQFLSLFTTSTSRLLSGVICFAITCIFIFRVILVQKNKSIFKKLNFQGNEIEIFEESDDSYFDKYLNEVLYLFENVEEDVVVFEDMDRFDANRIFERLHEINTLVNLQRKKDGKAVLRFFYLLRDDIFISKDRTKFFDFIIPVVPVVDSSNSYNKFISHLKKMELYSSFNEGFLQGLSLYVDDMRLLKNICNEFLIYYNRLNTTELDYNKMLALVTYKNLFPRDFSDLQLNKGFVYTLFYKKPDFIKGRRSEIQEKISELKQRVTDADREVTESRQELDTIYNPKRSGYLDRLNEVDQANYQRRLQAVSDKSDNRIQGLEKEIAATEKELQKLESAPLACVITRENVDKIFRLESTNEIDEKNDFREVRGNEYFALVKYLIRNGYIDETYADYMTYFYEDSLSRIDKTFLRSITDKKAKPYNYELKSPKMVFSRLQPNDFDQEEALNFMLCDYLLSKKGSSEHLEHLIAQIRDSKKYAFVAQFFNCTANMSLFIQIFSKYWPSIFADMQSEDGFSGEQLRNFSINMMYFLDSAALENVNENEVLTEYINSSKDYLDIEAPKVDELIAAFKQLGICFPEIDYDRSEENLLRNVYEKDMYELNFGNITMFLKNLWHVDSIQDIMHKNYNIISRDKNSSLFNRISNNMPKYISIVLQECNEQILDDEDAAIELLNCADINKSQKERYIQYLNTPMQILSSVDDKSIWEALLNTEILLRSEQNVLDYFDFAGELDDSLIGFINSTPHPLKLSAADTILSAEQIESLSNEIVACNEILDEQYGSILTSLKCHYDNFNISDVQESKIIILIQAGIIDMNSDNLMYMRNEYPSETSRFIESNIEKYASIMNNGLFNQSELLDILSWDVADAIKLKLLSFSDTEISIIRKNYSPQICEYILKNNLEQTDMDELYLSYDGQPPTIQEIIFENAKENIDEIISEPNAAAISIKERLLKDTELHLEDRVRLLAAMLPNTEQADVCRYLPLLSFDEYIKIFDFHSKPKFEINQQSRIMLDAFKRKGWIFEYLEDESRPGFYKIHRKEPRKKRA